MPKVKYFSLYDFSKVVKESEIKKTIDGLKDFCFEGWGLNDNYRKAEKIRDILEFLNKAYDININIDWRDAYNMDLKQIESEINKQQIDIKIRLFAEWYYITFNNKDNETDFKKRMIEQVKKRCSSI